MNRYLISTAGFAAHYWTIVYKPKIFRIALRPLPGF